MRIAASLLAVPALLSFTTPAAASVFAWDFTGSGYTASGTLTTNDSNSIANPLPCATCADGPGFLVTGITGTINGSTITGVAALNSFFFNDNRFYSQTSNGALDFAGLGFTTATNTYKIFAGDWAGSIDQTYLMVNGDTAVNLSRPIEGNARLISGPVPEPATWAMMLVGFGAIGATMRRRTAQQLKVRFAV